VIRRATVAKKSAKQVIRREAETEGHVAGKKAAPTKKVIKKEAETQGHKSMKKGQTVKREAETQGHVHSKRTVKKSNDPESRIH
jgi:hypothetical protein